MKKVLSSVAALFALAASATAAQADKVALNGACKANNSDTAIAIEGTVNTEAVYGGYVVTNPGEIALFVPFSVNPGVTQFSLPQADFDALIAPKLMSRNGQPKGDAEGFVHTQMGYTQLSYKQNGNTVTVRTSSADFNSIMNLYLRKDWNCTFSKPAAP